MRETIYKKEVKKYKTEYVSRHEKLKADFTEAYGMAVRTAKQMEELHEEGFAFLKTLYMSTRSGMEEDLRSDEYKMPKEVDAKSWGDYPGEMAALVEASEKDRGRGSRTRRPEDKAKEEGKPQEKNREEEASKIKHYGMEGMEAPKQQRQEQRASAAVTTVVRTRTRSLEYYNTHTL